MGVGLDYLDLSIRARSPGTAGSSSPVLFTYNFMTSPSMPTGLALSRASTGTRFNGSGTMVTEVIDAPRFQNVYSSGAWGAAGLLAESQKTTYLDADDISWSFHFTQAGTTNGTHVAGLDGVTGAQGQTSGHLMVPDTSNSARLIYRNVNTLTTSNPFTLSCWAKPSGYHKIALREGGSTSISVFLLTGSGSVFNSVSVAPVTASGSIKVHDASYYRLSALFTPSSSVGTTTQFTVLDDAYPGGTLLPWNFYSFSGDGTSGITLFGWQLEDASFASSFIYPAEGGLTFRTRSADIISASGTLATQLAAGPSVWEMTDLATDVTSRTSFAAGAFTFPVDKLYRSFGVYPAGTNTAPYLTVGGAY